MLSRDVFRTERKPKFYEINVALESLTLLSCSSDIGHALREGEVGQGE